MSYFILASGYTPEIYDIDIQEDGACIVGDENVPEAFLSY
jgi:hypothetical protein